MKIFVLVLAVFLVGCDLSRKETIDGVKECENAGMRAVILKNGFTSKPRAVICKAKDLN